MLSVQVPTNLGRTKPRTGPKVPTSRSRSWGVPRLRENRGNLDGRETRKIVQSPWGHEKLISSKITFLGKFRGFSTLYKQSEKRDEVTHKIHLTFEPFVFFFFNFSLYIRTILSLFFLGACYEVTHVMLISYVNRLNYIRNVKEILNKDNPTDL